MFQFTTTNVINSQQDLTTGLPLWSLQKKTEKDGTTTTTLNLKRINNFNKDNVVAIYKSEYTPSKKDKLTIDFGNIEDPELKNGDGFRLSIYIRLSQSLQSSYYSNDMVFKGKPFSVEFAYKNDWETTLDKLKKTIEKYAILVYEKPLLKVSVVGDCLTIEATDEYQRLYQVDIEKFDPKAYNGMGSYNVVRSIEDLPKIESINGDEQLTGSNEGYFIGQEGFGTYQWLLHNLRLPTTARTRIYAMNSDETPIPGAKYNEYVIHYCKNRGILGTNAVGDLVKSMTTHVLYVNQDLLGKEPEGDLPEPAPGSNITWEKIDIEGALEAIAPEGKLIEVSAKRNRK